MSESCEYVEVMLKVMGRNLADIFLVFFLKTDAIFVSRVRGLMY